MAINAEDLEKLIDKLSGVEDYRRQDEGNIRHKLVDIIVMAFTAVLCGMQKYEEIEDFCRAKEAWFKTFLELPHGTPCAITFYRVLRAIKPEKLAEGLQGWLFEVKLAAGYEVNIDGKTIRGSIRTNMAGFHIVSAWVGASYLTLGQIRTAEHSNEITAIPALLDMLDIRGALVTIDAMGCQKAITEKIITGGGDYLLAVKENQSELYRQIKEYFDWCEGENWAPETVEAWKSGSEKGHGRIEQREYAVSENVDWLFERDEWKGIKTIVRNRSWREQKDAASGEWQPATVFDRYYISSLDLSAEEMGKRIRNHWSIENNLHWMLDVDFGEDDDLKQTMHAPENMNILRKTALSCIKRAEPEKKKSLKHYMRQAMFYDEYRKHLLFDSK